MGGVMSDESIGLVRRAPGPVEEMLAARLIARGKTMGVAWNCE